MATYYYYPEMSSTISSINTIYIDPFISNSNVYNDIAVKQYPKEKDKKVFLILNSKEKSYKVAPDDCHF